jgi:hypothetical protein
MGDGLIDGHEIPFPRVWLLPRGEIGKGRQRIADLPANAPIRRHNATE